MKETYKSQLAKIRRNLILDAAIEVIAENGFQRTTIKQIAQQAGVADGTIYNYFKNKDAILMGIIERLSEAEIRDMHVADAQQLSIEELIINFVPQRMKEADDAYPLFKAIFPEMLTNEALVRQIYDEVYMPVFPIMEHYFQTLIEQGVVTGQSEIDGEQTQMDPAVMYWTRCHADSPSSITRRSNALRSAPLRLR